MEDRLRGRRGRIIRRLDTKAQQRIPPQPGHDVDLTLDIKLQARVQAIMSPQFGLMRVQKWHRRAHEDPDSLGQPLTGAAVVASMPRPVRCSRR